MRLFKTIGVLACVTACATQGLASGYMIPEQGTKAVGMANAFSGVADDPSANWYNPAGLAFQENGAMLSSDVIIPTNKYVDMTGIGGYTAEKKVFVVPQAYLNYRPEGSDFTYGLGINAPFGLSTNWGSSRAPFSQVLAGASSVTFSQIEGIHVNPNVVYRLTEGVSLAAGLAYYNMSKVHLDSQALKIGGHGDGMGSNFALMYKQHGFGLGVSYRSPVTINVSGTAVGGPAVAMFGLQGVAGKVSTSVKLPALLMLGASYQWNDWLFSAQVDRIDWSSFDKIDLQFAPSALNRVTGSKQTIKEGWKNTTAYRVGAQWTLSPESALRFGYTSDPTPVNSIDISPRLPGNDRQFVTVGYGVKLTDQIDLDLAYGYVWLKDRMVTTAATPIYNGMYRTFVHLFSGGLVYRF